MRRLPPLSALRAFESAARLGSFKKAAAELAVTPAAISHQIRTLEEHTGLHLFERTSRQVIITSQAAQLLPVLQQGFDAFQAILELLTGKPKRAQVTISATTAFACKWLVPRVAGFQLLHPDIDLQIHASESVVDLAGDGTDLAIRYGAGNYPGHDIEMMFEDHFSPIVNSSLNVKGADCLYKLPRIHFHWARKHPRNPTWEGWFAAAGLQWKPPISELRFTDESHAIQAAVAGQGIALLSRHLVRDELFAGQVMQPFTPDMHGHTYYLVRHAGRPATDAVAAVMAWIRNEAELTHEGCKQRVLTFPPISHVMDVIEGSSSTEAN